MRLAHPGQALRAEGVLQNPVPVEALYDRDAAHEVTLRNLLQRKGFEGLEAVRAEGRAEGRRDALRQALAATCERLGVTPTPDPRAALAAADSAALRQTVDVLRRTRALP